MVGWQVSREDSRVEDPSILAPLSVKDASTGVQGPALLGPPAIRSSGRV